MPAQNEKQQEIMKRYLDLPEDVQKALFSTKTSDAIFEVGKKHWLAIDKMGELSDETGLVMLGMTRPSEYIRNLEKRLGVEAIKAKEIAEDINQKVFSPIRESLKKIHGITPTPAPAGGPPPLTVRGGGDGGSVTEGDGMRVRSEKIDQILKNHEAIKQARKHIMPEQPENIKVGEIAKPTEPKVDIKPLISGRIDEKTVPPSPLQRTLTNPQTRRDEGVGGQEMSTEVVPDIFLRHIPTEDKPKIVPDFVPPKEEPIPQSSKEAKTTLNKALNGDPYKEPIQ